LVEEGQHDDLMERKGAYWRLYEAQLRQAQADQEAMAAPRRPHPQEEEA
jgi:ATP-binding cassette subfamily B protein